jgi:hypothetical protein
MTSRGCAAISRASRPWQASMARDDGLLATFVVRRLAELTVRAVGAPIDERHGASVRRRDVDIGPSGTRARPRAMNATWAVVGRDGPNVAAARDLAAALRLHPGHQGR